MTKDPKALSDRYHSLREVPHLQTPLYPDKLSSSPRTSHSGAGQRPTGNVQSPGGQCGWEERVFCTLTHGTCSHIRQQLWEKKNLVPQKLGS